MNTMEQDVDTGSSPVDQDVNSESSSESVENQPNLMDAIQSALHEPDEADEQGSQPDEPSEQSEGDDTKGEGEQPEASAEADDSGDANLPFGKHPRWQQVTRERREFKEQVESLRPAAENFERITGFLSENRISAEEAQQGFEIMAAMRNDPAKALELLGPYVDQLRQFTGEHLPDDLAEDLENGEISEQRARELARARSEQGWMQQQQRDQQQRFQQQQQQTAQTEMANAAATVEAELRASDPDFASKVPFLESEIRALATQYGAPQNAQMARQLVEVAYKNVNQRLGAMIPKPQPKRTVSGGRTSTASKRPESLMEAIESAL